MLTHMNIELVLTVLMKDQIEEIEEFGIPSIILSTKDDMLLTLGEVKYKLAFGTVECFIECKIQNML